MFSGCAVRAALLVLLLGALHAVLVLPAVHSEGVSDDRPSPHAPQVRESMASPNNPTNKLNTHSLSPCTLIRVLVVVQSGAAN
jgi:hypothetical protein